MTLKHPRLSHALMALRPDAKPMVDFVVEDTGDGPFLVEGSMKDPPSQEEVDSLSTDDLDLAQARKNRPLDQPSFLARELLAELTVDDYAAIQKAVATSAPLGLLWASLLAQGEAPIMSASERFQAGWAGLKAALGKERAAAIADGLGIPA